MKTEKSLSRYILVVLSISVVLTALIIVALNAYVNNQRLAQNDSGIITGTAKSLSSYDEGYKDGYKTAREKFLQNSEEMFSLIGIVLKNEDSSILVEAVNLNTDALVDGIDNKRKIAITSSTEIVINLTLTDEEMETKMNKWRQSEQDTPPPLPFVTDTATIDDIKIDDNISAIATKNIRLEKEFIAEKIVINK